MEKIQDFTWTKQIAKSQLIYLLIKRNYALDYGLKLV